MLNFRHSASCSPMSENGSWLAASPSQRADSRSQGSQQQGLQHNNGYNHWPTNEVSTSIKHSKKKSLLSANCVLRRDVLSGNVFKLLSSLVFILRFRSRFHISRILPETTLLRVRPCPNPPAFLWFASVMLYVKSITNFSLKDSNHHRITLCVIYFVFSKPYS